MSRAWCRIWGALLTVLHSVVTPPKWDRWSIATFAALFMVTLVAVSIPFSLLTHGQPIWLRMAGGLISSPMGWVVARYVTPLLVSTVETTVERRQHNDLDYNCKHWCGGVGYNHLAERCYACNPKAPVRLVDPERMRSEDVIARYIVEFERLREDNR